MAVKMKNKSYKMEQNGQNASIPSSTWRKAQLLATTTLFCCINMVFYEQTLRLKPGSSHLLAFVQHLFITIIGMATLGFPYALFGNHQPAIPIRKYVPLVVLNYFNTFAHNISLNFGISIPLNMVFKSSSLIANLLLGMAFLGYRYSLAKYLSVLQITVGLILCTLEDYRVKHSMSWAVFVGNLSSSTESDEPSQALWHTTLGIVAMTTSLILSAGTGIYQEHLQKRFGKHPMESLYYVHFLALPLILICSKDDLLYYGYETAIELASGQYEYTFYLILTVLAQWCCASSVFTLTTECSSLTVTLCLTNRKFLSLLFSITFFGNVFTSIHWIGAFIVFSGTVIFANADFRLLQFRPSRLKQQ